MSSGNDSKTLRIQSQVDTKALKQMEQSLKSLSNVTGNLKKSIHSVTEGFKNFVKILSDKSIKDSIKNIEQYTAALNKLNRSLHGTKGNNYRGTVAGLQGIGGGAGGGRGNFPTFGGGTPQNPLYVSVVGMGGAASGSGGAGNGTIMPLPGGGFALVPNGGGRGGGRGSRGNGDWFGGGQPIGMGATTGDAAGSRQIARSIAGFSNIVQELKTAPIVNQAASNSFHGGIMRRMASGDYSDLDVIYNRPGDFGVQGLLRASGQNAMKTGNMGRAIDSALAGAQTGGFGGAGAGAIQGVKDAALANATGEFAAREASSMNLMLDAQKQSMPYRQMMWEGLSSQASGRLALNRITQGRGGSGALMGRYGVDLGEMAGFLGSGRQFGVDAMMGGRTAAGMRATGREVLRPEIAKYIRDNNINVLSPEIAGNPSLSAAFGPGGAAMMPEMKMGFRQSRGLAQTALDLEQRGYDRSTMLGAAGQFSFGIKGDRASAGGKAGQELEKILRKAFAAGLTDAQLGEQIAQSVADVSLGKGGYLSNLQGVSSAFTLGLGNQTSQAIQQRVSGLESLGQVSQGNPYLAAVEMERMKAELGSDFSQNAMLTLHGASLTDLIGRSPEVMSVLRGQSTDDQNRILKAAGRAKVDPMLQTLAGGSGKEAQMLRQKFQETGDWQKVLQDPEMVDIVANLAGTTGLMKGDFETRREGLRGYSVLGQEAIDGGRLPGRRNGLALAKKQADVGIQNQIWSDLMKPENSQAFAKVLGDTGKFFESIKGNEFAGADAAVKLVEALKEFVNAVQNNPQAFKTILGSQNMLEKKIKGTRGN